MNLNYDIIIVGASIAGAASAITLAPEGYRILLLDQTVFPRDKPCGEGIMPQGVGILAGLGLLSEILAHGGVKVRGMRFRNLQGVWAQGDFPGRDGGSFGIVFRRLYLDHLLLHKAKSFSNVTVWQGFKVTEVIREGQTVQGVAGHPVDFPDQRKVFHAPLTIGADGRYSVFHSQGGLKKTYLRRRRFGVTGHLEGAAGPDQYVEVLIHPQGEIYTAPCGGGITLIALLLEEKAMPFFAGDLSGRYLHFLRAAEGVGERMSTCELASPVFAVGPLGFTIEPCYRPGLLLVGDSAGFLDPITGEGMTLALKSIQAAAPLIKQAFALGNFGMEFGRQYAEERFRLIEDIFRLTLLLLNLTRYKVIVNRAIRRLSRDERLFQKLLGIAAGYHRYRDLSLGEKVSLFSGWPRS